MENHGIWEITIAGLLGGLILSWLDFIDDLKKPAGSDRNYAGLGPVKMIMVLSIWPFVGGAVAWASVSSETLLNPFQGLLLGLGGPSIIGYAGPRLKSLASRREIPPRSE